MTSFIQYNVFNSARYCRLLSYERKLSVYYSLLCRTVYMRAAIPLSKLKWID
jgi:hypothetical protein